MIYLCCEMLLKHLMDLIYTIDLQYILFKFYLRDKVWIKYYTLTYTWYFAVFLQSTNLKVKLNKTCLKKCCLYICEFDNIRLIWIQGRDERKDWNIFPVYWETSFLPLILQLLVILKAWCFSVYYDSSHRDILLMIFL